MSGLTLVTGASGFIGCHLLAEMRRRGLPVRAAVRHAVALEADSVEVGELDGKTSWRTAVAGVETIVHLAGRAHVMRPLDPASELAALRRINVEASRTLALAAAGAGVRRLVYVSSIGVLAGAESVDDATPPRPAEPYALSKLEAEAALEEVAASTDLELVIVRPPSVCGPGVPGNLRRLLGLIDRGLPIPEPRPANRRSLIDVRSLVEFLLLCREHPDAAGGRFVVADAESLSTADIVRELAKGMGKRARLVPAPGTLLRALAGLAGRAGLYDKIYGSLRVEPVEAVRRLGWQPPRRAREGLSAAGAAYARARRGLGER